MAIHRHLKTGGLYSVLGMAEILVSGPLRDHMICTLLRNRATGALRIVAAPTNPEDVSPRFSLAGPVMIQTAKTLRECNYLLVYSNTATSQQYARPLAEFNDGRFAPRWEPNDDKPMKAVTTTQIKAKLIVDTMLTDLLVQVFENDAGAEKQFLDYAPKAYEFVQRELQSMFPPGGIITPTEVREAKERPITMNPALGAPYGAHRFAVGDPVKKIGGDYTFEGIVRAVFAKRSGEVRFVVEDDRGVLHVYSAKNLAPAILPFFSGDEMMKDREKAKAEFMRKLAVLTHEYGIAIDGCGCCGSPSLEDVSATLKPGMDYTHDQYFDIKWSGK